MNFKQIMITIVIIIFFAISLIVAWIFFKPFLDPALKPEDKDSVNSLEEWKTQCLIKGKETYDGDQLRNKLGQKSKILYDIDANEHRYRYEKDLLNEE
ncbi:MAG: hypothetical protein U9532_03560 ['Conium maculatum' witches'-broom phytoplasma]|nr:hypothetical protein ['Conium maculatum' witches'-broom phytoplasma]